MRRILQLGQRVQNGQLNLRKLLMKLRKFEKKDHVISFFRIPLQSHGLGDFLLTDPASRPVGTLDAFMPAA